jgi:hypothetical protein
VLGLKSLKSKDQYRARLQATSEVQQDQ